MNNSLESELKKIASDKKVNIYLNKNCAIFSNNFYALYVNIDVNIVHIHYDWKLDKLIGIFARFISKTEYNKMKLLIRDVSKILKEEKFIVSEIRKNN